VEIFKNADSRSKFLDFDFEIQNSTKIMLFRINAKAERLRPRPPSG
jgi:hypothetical protein